MSSAKKSTERLIKKYPNRRLYDTQTSSYITLSDVKQLVLDSDEFTVVDAPEEACRQPDVSLVVKPVDASGGPAEDALVDPPAEFGTRSACLVQADPRVISQACRERAGSVPVNCSVRSRRPTGPVDSGPR